MSILVVIKPEQDRAAWIAALSNTGLPWSGFDNLPLIFKVEGTTAATFPLRAHPGVKSAEDEIQVRVTTQPLSLDAALSGANWGLARIIRRRAPWPVDGLQFPLSTYFRCARDGTGVDYYAADSGILPTHTEFGGRATLIYDSLGTAQYFHGTFTSSIACGATAGVARGALVWMSRALDSTGAGTDTNIINALSQVLSHYNGRAATNRPAVCNMSIAGSSSAISSAVSSLIDAGIVVCTSAGNNMQNIGSTGFYPAESDPDDIVVGGAGAADIPYCNAGGGAVYGTNHGPRVDIMAPGQQIYAATNTANNAFVQKDGTSCAAPLVSAAVACMLQGHARLTGRTQVQAVKAQLLANATTGRFRTAFGMTLPDRLLYLDPNLASPEAIPGL